MSECQICPFIVDQSSQDEDVLLQTDYWSVVLDRNQPYLGKSFVTARHHTATISDLDDQAWSDLHAVMGRMEQAIKRAFNADVINWEGLMNNAVKAGQPTHVHWHLYPRYLSGATYGGEEFPDPKWPRHLEGARRVVDVRLFQKIANEIRGALHGN